MRRPDSTDQARLRAKCEEHLRGHLEPAPSPGWRPRFWRPVVWTDLRLVWEYVLRQTQMIKELGERTMATQDQVNALAASVTSDVAAIRAEVDEIKANHPDVDLSGLEAAVASLHQTAQDIDPSPEAPVDSGDGSAPADGSVDASGVGTEQPQA